MKTTSSDPALLVGLDAPDDAAVYRISAEVAMVQTVDFFTPVVDDARAWGGIAAANALSDIYAMGARPATALNLVGWPRSLDFELLGKVLEGAGEICDSAGVAVVGGHSVDDPEPKFGLAVTGFVHPDEIVRKGGAQPRDRLVLTKPLGSGIISSAIKEGAAPEAVARNAVEVMSRLNADAAVAMVEAGARAATDVTGFGLVGHLLQMLDPTISARLHVNALPVIDGVVELAQAGILPGGSKRNRDAHERSVRGPRNTDRDPILFDAQTSGGLLIAIGEDRVDDLMTRLQRKGVLDAAVVADFVEGDGTIEVLA